MKIPFFFITIITAIAAFGFSATAQANPPVQQQQVVARAPQAANASASAKSDPSRVPTTMGNYWDANQWDREGGASFWHSTTEAKGQSNGNHASKNAKKGGRFVKKLFKR